MRFSGKHVILICINFTNLNPSHHYSLEVVDVLLLFCGKYLEILLFRLCQIHKFSPNFSCAMSFLTIPELEWMRLLGISGDGLV